MRVRCSKNISGGRLLFWGALFLLLAAALFPADSFAGGDDWQYWNSFEVQKDLGKELTLRGVSDQRLRDDFSDLYTYNFSGGFLWKPVKYFDIGPFVHYEHEKNARGRHVNEMRWMLESSLKRGWKKWSFSDRSRLEYRDKNVGDDGWRYRNRIKVSYPLKVRGLTVSPYLSEEIFWTVTDSELNQNRLAAGVSTRLTQHLSVSTYYMWRARKTGKDWDDEHILGTGVAINL